MLMLTRDAARVIRQLADGPGARGLRIAPSGQHNGDSPGFRLELAPAPDVEDQVMEADGAQVFLAPAAADALSDKVLDIEFADEQANFAVFEQHGEQR